MKVSLKQKNDLKGLFIRIFICLLIASLAIYLYIFKQNEVTELRLIIPSLAKELRNIHEDNNRYRYEIENFESPIHLMELMRLPEFSGLVYPYTKDILLIDKPAPLEGKDLNDLLGENHEN
jgi:hypothetical protein